MFLKLFKLIVPRVYTGDQPPSKKKGSGTVVRGLIFKTLATYQKT